MSLDVERRKLAGAYYTSESVADLLAALSVRTREDRILEPCFGEGVFIEACQRRLSALGAGAATRVVGVDADDAAVAAARRRFAGADLLASDFFALDPGCLGHFDVVIGNPPFVRYHRFRGAARDLGLMRARQAGVVLPALASAWAPFLVHATQHLAPGGRLAVVAPLELTYARYARPFVAFLSDHFAKVRALMFAEPLFPTLNEATVLLVAEGWGASCAGLELVHLDSVASLDPTEPFTTLAAAPAVMWDGREESPRLLQLPQPIRDLYRSLVPHAVALGQIADLTIGYVTGDNRWFHLPADQVDELGLRLDVRMTLRRNADLTAVGLCTGEADRRALGERGAHWLFTPEDPLRPAAAARIRSAEEEGVQTAYKCRVRQPWWRVPGVRGHDFVVGVLSTRSPRVVATDLPAANSLLVGDLCADVWPPLLAAASLTSLSALSAEVVGHALGGGALKLEPAEARRWLLPVVPGDRPQLAAIDMMLRTGRTQSAVDEADRVLLRDRMGLSASEVDCLRRGVAVLRDRRLGRHGS